MEAYKIDAEFPPAQKRTILPADCRSFARTLAGFATLASDDMFRGELHYIRMISDGTTLTLTATNGHILGCKRYSLDGDQKPMQAMIPAANIRAICASLRQSKGDCDWAVITYQDQAMVFGRDEDAAHPGGLYFGSISNPLACFVPNPSEQTLEAKASDYPEIKRVLPQGTASLPSGRIGFNVNLFAPYFKAVYGNHEQKIEIRYKSEIDGFRIIDMGDPDLYMLVMPLRLESTDAAQLDAPNWVK